jgi:putative transposase
VLDQCTRKVVGWALASHMRTSLCLEALTMALDTHQPPRFHHSDRGGQYCSREYQNELQKQNITPSMADVGVSVDNPFAESFNRSLKVEEVYLNAYESIARSQSFDCIVHCMLQYKATSLFLGVYTSGRV